MCVCHAYFVTHPINPFCWIRFGNHHIRRIVCDAAVSTAARGCRPTIDRRTKYSARLRGKNKLHHHNNLNKDLQVRPAQYTCGWLRAVRAMLSSLARTMRPGLGGRHSDQQRVWLSTFDKFVAPGTITTSIVATAFGNVVDRGSFV